jgi:dTMP kinase
LAPGRFITLEGGEGAGKSTLAGVLAEDLRRAGKTVVVTREPGGTPGADEIRRLLVTGGKDRWSALTETLLLAAARNDHLERVIRPALLRGDWVVCDRFIDSTWAYQVAAGGLDASAHEALARLVNPPMPDLTLVLDVDPAAGLSRARSAAAGEDRYETLGKGYHAAVRAAFLAVAAGDPGRCVVIDTSQARETVQAAARQAISSRLHVSI